MQDHLTRYSVIEKGNKREIVLLKGRRCVWGRCSFCDYIDDNLDDEQGCVMFNEGVLSQVTGCYRKLEVINSGSVFELPIETLAAIRTLAAQKDIQQLYFECYYHYKNRLDEIRDFFHLPIQFKCGIETFDDDFRNNVLHKGIHYSSPEEVAQYFDAVCLLVGVKGQTQAMIDRDIDLVLHHFKHGCINIYRNNTTPIKADESIICWFKENYSDLEKHPKIEILWNNTDFGVG